MDHSELYRRMGVHCSHKTLKQEKAVKPELRAKMNTGGNAVQKRMVSKVMGLKPRLLPSRPKQAPMAPTPSATALKKGGHCEK